MMLQSQMMLDGNAIGGLLSEIFVPEMTSAQAVCASCGAMNPIGRTHVFVHAPGAVVRCPGCESVLLRVVHGSGRYWLDLTGARSVMLAET